MNKVYKVKKSFLKSRNGEDKEIEKYYFLPYKSENDDEVFYACGVLLPKDSKIVKKVTKDLEHYYTEATEEQRKEDFSCFEFAEVKDNDKIFFKLVLTDKTINDISSCQLCFSVNGKLANTLFINGPDGVAYFNSKILDEHVGLIIKNLRKNGVIRAVKVKEGNE